MPQSFMPELEALHSDVVNALHRFARADKSARAERFESLPGRAWFLKLHEGLKGTPPLDAVVLAGLDFELPADYRHFLLDIASGGLASDFGLLPFTLQNAEELVHNFERFEEYRVADFEDASDDEYWLPQFHGARGVLLGQEAYNGHEVFMVCEGHLPGSVWLFDQNSHVFAPLARSFEEHVSKNLENLQGMLTGF